MPKSKIPLNEQIATIKTEIRQNENHIKMLLQKKTHAERNARTRRLIERGAILESVVYQAESLTNEQLKQLLRLALATYGVREMLASFFKENETNASENPTNEMDTL